MMILFSTNQHNRVRRRVRVKNVYFELLYLHVRAYPKRFKTRHTSNAWDVSRERALISRFSEAKIVNCNLGRTAGGWGGGADNRGRGSGMLWDQPRGIFMADSYDRDIFLRIDRRWWLTKTKFLRTVLDPMNFRLRCSRSDVGRRVGMPRRRPGMPRRCVGMPRRCVGMPRRCRA